MVILDANILIRAVLGKRVREILETHSARVRFFAPDTAFAEARARSVASGATNRWAHVTTGCPVRSSNPPSATTADRMPGAERWVTGIGDGSLLCEEAVDTRGCPSRDAATEEVSVFGPDRTSEGQDGCKNRPVVRVASGQPFSCLRLKV